MSPTRRRCYHTEKIMGFLTQVEDLAWNVSVGLTIMDPTLDILITLI